MRMLKIVAALAITLCTTTISAQEAIRKVENVTVKSLDGEAAVIPYWGEKNLMIFYVDPDRAGQNSDFAEYLEESHRAEGENLVGLGVMNLKDAPFIPNTLARKMAMKRTEKNKALILSDEGRVLSEAWNLGDCNNLFVSILINRDGEILYVKKGVFSEDDKEEFLEWVDKLK